MEVFKPGQRWVSDSEPELGLGEISEVGFRDVKIAFRAADTVRTYMQRGAPLRRVRLKAGERARTREGKIFVVRGVQESDGVLTYSGEGMHLPEQELLDSLSFSDPDKRLLAGQVGKPRDYLLRMHTQAFRREVVSSPEHGLVGARVQLLPHQISIAERVSQRHHPRVLLADEVGLGKTIEAGLIFHRLFVTGQVDRVLIVTPPHLVHQWLVEMYRRFNHMFTVMDEDLARSEEKGNKQVNPFLGRQTVICGLDFLSTSKKRVEQAAAAGFDLLIVDEAHHLTWSPEMASPEYAAVEKLATVSSGVLLITATPVQLGEAGHFGRLRLLDANRFPSLEKYREEVGEYREVADAARVLTEKKEPDTAVAEALRKRFSGDGELLHKIDAYLQGASGSRDGLLFDLVDRHGTGRLMFRNRRQAMSGFPRRIVRSAPLENSPAHKEFTSLVLTGPGVHPDKPEDLANYLNGPAAYNVGQFKIPASEAEKALLKAWRRDPRLNWLVGLLKEVPDEKILLICSHKSVVFALQEILPTFTTVDFTAFHENMILTTRDRNAAYFARPDGARLLLSSEIGSEGRNFQFAHHLVLFDLPLNPSVLEQRIGRLDRIGQLSDIYIHVPYVKDTAHEVLYRWYSEGLDAFEHPLLGSDYFYDAQAEDIRRVCIEAMHAEAGMGEGAEIPGGAEENPGFQKSLDALVARTRALAVEVKESLEKGRDRLLEINSSRPELARGLIEAIESRDANSGLEQFLETVFNHYGVDIDKTKERRGHFVFPGPQMYIDTFPGLPEAGIAFTYDRDEALIHEDLAFMSVDHPLVLGAVEMILGNADGTVAFVEWKGAPKQGFALETQFILESTAPGRLHMARFLPPTLIRLLVNQTGDDVSDWLTQLDEIYPDQGPTALLEEHHDQFGKLIPKLLNSATGLAGIKETVLKQHACKLAQTVLGGELDRLTALRNINPSVSDAEIKAAKSELEEVLGFLASAELRLDAVRLVMMAI